MRWKQPLGAAAALLVLLLAGPARGGEEKAAPDKLDLESLMGDEKSHEETAKGLMEEAGKGDGMPFAINTDDDIGTLQVGDVYRNEEKTFFKVVGVEKAVKGGSIKFERTHGKTDPGQKLLRVLGVGPEGITARITLLDYYFMGGVFLHPIALLGVCTIVLALNCAWLYRRGRQIPAKFVAAARSALAEGRLDRFQELALKERGLMAQLCRAMAERFSGSTSKDLQDRVEVTAAAQIGRLRVPIRLLNLISAGAPLLGLLGTIVGMVIVFDAVSGATGASKAQQLAAGIRIKLFCTAFALMVAIPALFLYFLCNQRLTVIVAECELTAEEFIYQISRLLRLGGGHGVGEERQAGRAAGSGSLSVPQAQPAAPARRAAPAAAPAKEGLS